MTGARGTAAPCYARERSLLRWYLPLQAIILPAIQACKLWDFWGHGLDLLMYSAVAINTVVVLVWGSSCCAALAVNRTWALGAGLLVTALADVCLTLIDTSTLILPGVVLFCIVQAFYAVCLGLSSRTLLARMFACATILLALVALGRFKTFLVAGAIDIALLLCNVVQAWRQRQQAPGTLFALGLMLFLACDLCVGLAWMGLGNLSAFASFMVWIFYVPAQVLITLSFVRQVEAYS